MSEIDTGLVFVFREHTYPSDNKELEITCRLLDGHIFLTTTAVRSNGEKVVIEHSPLEGGLTRIIHGLEEARRRFRRYWGYEVPHGSQVLARSDVGLAYLHEGRLVVEAPGARLEMEVVDLEVLSEIDALIQAAGDFIAEGAYRG